MVGRLTKAASVLVALAFLLGAGLAAAAVPPEAYSWVRVFAGPGSYNYSSAWQLDSPFQGKHSVSDWKPVSLPFNQPEPLDDPYGESPHRGMDFTGAAVGTNVYALAYGVIVSVSDPDALGRVTIVQDVDFENDKVLDGIRIEYRQVTKTRNTPGQNASVSPTTFLGTVCYGPDGTIPRLHIRLTGLVGTSWLVTSPYYFYDNAVNWQFGNDTSFTGSVFSYASDLANLHIIAYGRGAAGEIVPPSEVTVFHQKYTPGQALGVWRESQMTQVSSAPYTYAFDFFDYLDPADGKQYYFPDGETVAAIIRLRFGSNPDLYQWAFTPAAYERPFEDVNQWSGRQVWFYYMTMPNDPLPHSWYSQMVADQDDARCRWNNHSLNGLLYPSIVPPNGPPPVPYDPDRNITPFDWDNVVLGDFPGAMPNRDGQPVVGSGLMQQAGCNACSWAMVLKNLGQQGKYLRRDIRYGITPPDRYLAADPFGVTIASCQDFDQQWDAVHGHYHSLWQGVPDWSTPVSLVYGPLLTEYGVTAKWRKFGHASLAADVGDLETDTTITVTNVVNPFPTASLPFWVSIQTGEDAQPEVMKVTAIDGNTLTVIRGQLGTARSVHKANNKVYEGSDELKAMVIYNQLLTHSKGIIVQLHGHYMVFTATSLTQQSFNQDHWNECLAWASREFDPISPGAVEPEFASDLGQVGVMVIPYPPTPFEQGFTVCDPASRTPDAGANVLFTNCVSFNHPKRLFEVESITVVELPTP